MRWTLKNIPQPSEITHLQEVLQVHPLIATLLVQRGIKTFEQARAFFRPSLKDLHDPYLMKDMNKAIDRIEKALKDGERILVFGDYDVDGTTAVALMSSYLRTIGGQVDTYIPDRYTEGYGVSYRGIDYAADNGFTLIIALDCGIKSPEQIAYASQKGIDFIICDHHMPGDVVPDAVAVLDAKQKDCNYPYDELCGCGVGFKVIQALNANRGNDVYYLMPYLDLVATAIAADIVPITGENRILAYFGLQVINTNPRPGLRALKEMYNISQFTITDVVFKFAPKINAAGRIKHGNYAVKLLTEFNIEEAIRFSEEIEAFNKSRKELDKAITQEALAQIEAQGEQEAATTVVYNENWHKGVIGIVASRLIEKYYRPTIVFTKSGDYIAASARSVKGFDIYQALEACAEHLIQFGGHMYAAGMTCKLEKFQDFKNAFETYVQNHLPKILKEPELEIDAVINFSDLTPKNLRILKQMEPHGPQNMSPVFLTKNVFDTGYAKCFGSEGEHLKLFVKQNYSEPFPAIAFGKGSCIEMTRNQRLMHIVYSLDENEFNKKKSWQLHIKDILF